MIIDSANKRVHAAGMGALNRREDKSEAAIAEFDSVRLLERVDDVPAGTEGAVVHVFEDGAMLVEFFDAFEGVKDVQRRQVVRLFR